jgi:large subunit ribosomal protein L28
MSVVCEVCGKKPTYGHNVSHAKNRTARRWVPNVQHKRVMINGVPRRVHICTRCLRTLTKRQGMLPV